MPNTAQRRRDRLRVPGRGGHDHGRRHGQLLLSRGHAAPQRRCSSRSSRPPCTQTAGAIWQPSPPLPWYQQGPGWAGSCRFDAPGVYQYHSGLDWNMRGSVTVVAPPPSAVAVAVARPAIAVRRRPSPSPSPSSVAVSVPDAARHAARGRIRSRTTRTIARCATGSRTPRAPTRADNSVTDARSAATRRPSASRPAQRHVRRTTSTSGPPSRPRACRRPGAGDRARRRRCRSSRCRPGWARQLHVQHARHLHVRVLVAHARR